METTTKVPDPTLSKAITALLNHHSTKTQSQNPQLLPSDNFIYLVLTLQKIPPKPRTNPFKIPLPHPLFDPLSTDICLIVDDSRFDSKAIKQKVADEGLGVDKVLKFSKLKTDYKAYESKRKLCDSYELFLCDKRVVPLLGKYIGKCFYRKRKVPLGVNLEKKEWGKQVERFCGSGLVFIGTGSCVVVKVGRVSMGENEILENLRVVIDGVVGIFGGKWENVRSLHLKMADSVALPLYQCLPKMVLKIDGGVGKIEGDVSVSESEGEGRRVGGKRKKGRIHEVMYMDDVGMIGGEDVDDDDDGVDEEGGMGSVESHGPKRKKGVKKATKVEEVAGKEDEEGEMGSVENRGSKRKKGDGEKKKGVKKVAKVKYDDEENEDGDGLKKKKKKGVKKVAKVKNVDNDGVMIDGEENEVGDGSKKKKKKGVKKVAKVKNVDDDGDDDGVMVDGEENEVDDGSKRKKSDGEKNKKKKSGDKVLKEKKVKVSGDKKSKKV